MNVRQSIATATTPLSALPITSRLTSLDLMRGAVIVLMAIDHVRVYSGLPAGGRTAGIFFTRWVTHFCAPAFTFLAGTGAFLYGKKINNRSALARFLVTRGLLLVGLELTLIRFSWTFNFDYSHFILAGVIWMLGWCMVLMAALIWLPTWAVGTVGLFIIFFQKIFQKLPSLFPDSVQHSIGGIYEFFYPANLPRYQAISILYVLIPWIGVMAAGYGFGLIVTRDAAQRRRLCLAIGLTSIILFLIFGIIFTLKFLAPGDPRPFLFRLLDQNKYPPSQLFLLMTLGPMIALLPLAERARGWFSNVLTTFGRVPLFYYLLHIPLIHITALLIDLLLYGGVNGKWYATAPFSQVPQDHKWTLWLLYVVFAVDVAILYAACRWYAQVKARYPRSLLRYL